MTLAILLPEELETLRREAERAGAAAVTKTLGIGHDTLKYILSRGSARRGIAQKIRDGIHRLPELPHLTDTIGNGHAKARGRWDARRGASDRSYDAKRMARRAAFIPEGPSTPRVEMATHTFPSEVSACEDCGLRRRRSRHGGHEYSHDDGVTWAFEHGPCS